MKAFFVLIFGVSLTLSVVKPIPLDSHQIDIFDTLDDYTLIHILEMVSWRDLITIASMSSRCNKLISSYNLISRHSIKKAILRIELSNPKSYTKALYLPVGAKVNLEFSDDHNSILSALKAFCPVFGHLHLVFDYNYPSNGDLTQEIVEYVNLYCATIPQKVYIQNSQGLFGEFILLNVSSVSIVHPEKFKSLSIHKHFPQLEELSIRIDGLFVLNENLPHLKHFELLDSACGRFDLMTFAEKNLQIRSVKLDLCEGLNSLQAVNEAFPDLESLHYAPKEIVGQIKRVEPRSQSLQRLPNEEENVIHFRNVKSYTIILFGDADDPFYARNFDQLKSIRIDQLESLTYISTASILGNDNLTGFVGQYKQLTRLVCSSYEITYEEVWRLVDSLPNLMEITIRPKSDSNNHQELLRLMKETNLDTIHVRVDVSLLNEFRTINLPSQWFLQVTEQNFLYTTALTYKRYKRNSNHVIQ